MKVLAFCLVALAASASSYAQSTIPDAPQLTVGAEFKGLRFDWEPVARVSWYQLEYRAHQTGPFVQSGDDYPASATSTRFSFPLHLFDWSNARYRLAACNSAGCARSAEISVSDWRRVAVGYFKPGSTLAFQSFGSDVDLSADGNHFVVAAPGDTTSADVGTRPSGAVYLFARRADKTWYQQARFEAPSSPFAAGDNVIRVAVSKDGTVVAVAMPNYQHEQNDPNAGEVFVMRWNGSQWVRFRAATSGPMAGHSGTWVSLSATGNTLFVGEDNPDIRAVGYNFYPAANNPSGVDYYSAYYFRWRAVPRVANHCGEGAISPDSSTVVQVCYRRTTNSAEPQNYLEVDHIHTVEPTYEIPMKLDAPTSEPNYGIGGIGVSQDGSTIAAQIYVRDTSTTAAHPSRVNVFKQSGNTWPMVAQLAPGSWRTDAAQDAYGQRLAVSGDGKTIAICDSADNGVGTGPRAAPLVAGNPYSGAVYVYRLSSKWQLANMVKPNLATQSFRLFGQDVALSQSANTLIVGDPTEDGNAHGVGGNWKSEGTQRSGAVWMY